MAAKNHYSQIATNLISDFSTLFIDSKTFYLSVKKVLYTNPHR